MRRADLAMYAAKAAGRARFAWFEPSLDERAAARAWLQAELPGALQRNELCLHFQPRLRADGGMASVEALVRWQHPSRGLIQPLQFVPLAEETGLIESLGRWVMDAACRQQRRWRDAGVPVPVVSVNVSAPQLVPAFADEVLALLHRHGLQPADLEVELTESLFAGDAQEVSARLAPLRAAGVRVALDDFGTGFSSLASLYRLPVDVIKIDRSFVVDLGLRASADAVTRSILALARALDKHVVAEGVETADQHRRLLALGCDEFQGFLLARPMPAGELERWLWQAVRRETQSA
jgi:EAL domain-containing protein (putative c-di-GMP-specific phosphodiesterase class I)